MVSYQSPQYGQQQRRVESYLSKTDQSDYSFFLRLEQSKKIYEGLCQLEKSKEAKSFDSAQKRIIQRKLLNAKLSGIGLSDEIREKFNNNAQELSRLSTEFSNNVLDATKSFSLVVTDKADMDGLPEDYLERASLSYKEHHKDKESSQEKGPWLITLDHPSFGPFLENSKNRDLREQLYLAFITRASEGKLSKP